MNVFIIAPDNDDLPDTSREIAAIAGHHDAEVLRGPVRDLDIGAKLEQLESDGFAIDCIWWITHGSKDGILLSDGLLDTQGAGQYVRTSAARLCIFNTCDSEDVALSIMAGSEADMIYTVGDVKNRVAVRFGILLALALATNEDCRTAYDSVAPMGGPYHYLEAKAQYRRYFARAEQETHSQLRIAIISLLVVVVLGGVGLYREMLVVEYNQARIIQNQEKFIDGQEKQLDSIRSLESRIIRLQLGMPGQEYVKDGP